MIGGKKWQKGQSGNPSGRSKSGFSFKKELEGKLNELVPKDYLGRTYGRAIIDKVVHKATQGNLKAIGEVLDRALGKPAQAILNGSLELTREQRIKQLEELLSSFPAVHESSDEHADPKPN